ncbi:Flp family type IVb pilin [Pseudarthrobacter sp. HLT3-5]|uniref:Flp family type IVb pilin n=1 Tax=Pseudarthrobacter cellobiosi TaxID=2953654 RepID=UPI00208FACAD|nr:Flp family type IVb pilin [Pseudarthrobacter sp. HLT3-5]MCO4275101.1 Flp family type IVb pilin [Pseudarthrobacter sp. HLT3-5]
MRRTAVRRFYLETHWLKQFAEKENGATATEYGILMAFIVMLIVTAVTFLGLELLGWYDELTAHLKLVLGIS